MTYLLYAYYPGIQNCVVDLTMFPTAHIVQQFIIFSITTNVIYVTIWREAAFAYVKTLSRHLFNRLTDKLRSTFIRQT